MTREQFKNELFKKLNTVFNEMESKDGFDFVVNVEGSELGYAVRITKLTENVIILVGGYGCEFYIVYDSQNDMHTVDTAIDEIERLFIQDFNDVKIEKNVELM